MFGRRTALAIITALLLASCDTLQGVLDPGAVPPDTIVIGVSGLPTDIAPDITLTGPAGYTKSLDGRDTISGLQPGEYVVTANAVTYGLNHFTPTRSATVIHLDADRGGRTGVTYRPHPDLTQRAIDYLNTHREAMGISAVSASPDALAHWLHARYATENDYWGHDQDPRLPFYTPNGRGAAQRSNLAYSSGLQTDPRWAIDAWLQAPFHNVHNLNPLASVVRFGIYFGAGEGVQTTAVLEPSGGGYVGSPVTWPGPGQTIDVLAHTGEWPSPLSSCPGYELPAGLPLLVFAGSEDTPSVLASALTSDGVALDHCVITGGTYHNTSPNLRDLGRNILDYHRAVLIVPKAPLRSGRTYDVSVVLRDGEVDWSFTTVDR